MSIIKKVFFLCLFIFFITLLLWGVYNLSFKKTETPKPAPVATTPVTPSKSEPAISLVTDESVISPVIDPSGTYIKYYSHDTGKVYRIDLDGKNKGTISSQELDGLNNVLWSPDQTKAINEFTSPDGQPQFFSYSYATQKAIPIKKNTDEIAWQSNSGKIFYKYYDATANKRSLNIADPDGSHWASLTDIDYRNISIAQIPKSGIVSFWNKPDAMTETIFQSMPIVSGEKKTILQGKFGADYLWSPDGNNILVSTTDVRGGSKMQLSVMNSNGGEYKGLDMPTMVSKCTWSKDNKTVYCALPGNIPASAIMPNEYINKKFDTTDTFWKIDTKTGKKDRIIEAEKIGNRYDATQMFFNQDESKLFFINRTDGKLYSIVL
jgi:hypothetical protein